MGLPLHAARRQTEPGEPMLHIDAGAVATTAGDVSAGMARNRIAGFDDLADFPIEAAA
jgi:hypothetical protein